MAMTKSELELLSTDESQPVIASGGLSQNVRRWGVMPAVVALTVGLVAGGVAHSFTEQSRLRPPMKPIASAVEVKYAANFSSVERKTASVPSSATQVGPDGWCGLPVAGFSTYVRCGYPGVCCLGTKGNICAGADGVCALGDAGVIACAPGAQGCVNDQGAAYCCAPGNKCSANVCLIGNDQNCFPGEATVAVKGVGAVPMQHLRIGDEVRVKTGAFEPVLGFLHVTGAGELSNFLTVKHATGELRVSSHHVVFVEAGDKLAIDLAVGDKVLVSEGSGVVMREVLSVLRTSGRSGMFAPLTPSGTVVVDNVVASNYASYGHVWFPHDAMHAAFFPVRAFHALGFAPISKEAKSGARLHPYAAALWKYVGPVATKVF